MPLRHQSFLLPLISAPERRRFQEKTSADEPAELDGSCMKSPQFVLSRFFLLRVLSSEPSPVEEEMVLVVTQSGITRAARERRLPSHRRSQMPHTNSSSFRILHSFLLLMTILA